ncbi:unnamed protein product [Closterium sp. NIES-64]|nr:unnamed protein product [Closterium sp. NIES-64]
MEQILAQGQASQQRHEDLAGAERSGVDSILPDLVVRLSGSVRGLLACGSSGRRFLLLCARARRWFLVNEPRIRFSLFLAVSALLVFYLRVQEEEYARVTRYP